MRVLYSFPHKLGADRICYTAWQQVRGISAAGDEVVLFAGALSREVPEPVEVHTTLSRGRLRIPYKALGKLRALAFHDWLVSRQLPRLANRIDVVHLWPCGALRTIRAAKQLGIPTVLERPNAHTRFCYEVVAAEHRRVGIETPHFDYRPNDAVLAREEAEFAETDFLLCPSQFAADSFLRAGFAEEKILRHQYGFDETRYFPASEGRDPDRKFTALFVGVDAVRKGLHLALEAWLGSPACQDGTFEIVGDLSAEFKQKFASGLAHPSVVQLGHRHDIPRLMQKADVLVLSTFEEGSALVCAEAIGAGCVPLASATCTDICRHMKNALIHSVGDVAMLRNQITNVYNDPLLLAHLRAGAIESRKRWTWSAAGLVLVEVYRQAERRSDQAVSPAEEGPPAAIGVTGL
jgi:glycosyltransferase involved in cell wall biosynthesis